jgi:lipid-A-disaccharide synthase
VEFVGHPLLDELNPKHFDPAAREVHRSKYGVGPGDLVLALMPGSRNSEIKHHLATQLQAARELLHKHPQLKVMLFVAPNFSKEQLQAHLSDLDFPLILIKDEPFSMIDLADVVLCASGTATLQVGLLEKPMVIMYKMNPFSAFIAKRFVNRTKYFGLINLVLDAPVVPELFQENAAPQFLVKALDSLLTSESERRRLAFELKPAKDRLGQRGATERVALALNEYWS